MKKQVILNFLNLPGIVGLGLIDGHSRPYFSGIDRALNFQQKEALTQGIQQVVSTTPPGFESFDFRFAQRDAHIYQLGNGVILLVVTDEQLERASYETTVLDLKETLETDPHSAVSTFRLLAGSTTLNKPFESVATSATTPAASASPTPPAAAVSASTTTPAEHPWRECLAALNVLTDATAQYLGKIVVANTWRNTRPDKKALSDLQIDRGGHFNLKADAAISSSDLISAEDYKMIHNWVAKFVQRCSMIIRDYPEMVLRQCLTDQQRAVLQIEISE